MVSAEDPFSLDCSADGDTMSFPVLRESEDYWGGGGFTYKMLYAKDWLYLPSLMVISPLTFSGGPGCPSDSIYDIIDPADHLTVRQQLAPPSALDTGENTLLSQFNICPTALPFHFCPQPFTSSLVFLSSPRSPLPLSLQHLQVPQAPECRQQTGAYSRSIPRSPTWGLLGRKSCVHSFLCSTGDKTPPWPWPSPGTAQPHSSSPCSRVVMLRTWPFWISLRK